MTNLHTKIEAIYPLSPMQQGLLFHSLYSPGAGVYVEQVSCRIERGLDVDAFKRSWQSVIDRHSILRTSFLWEGLGEPQQVVHKNVELPWKQEDLRRLTAAEQSEFLRAFLAKDSEAGFEFSRAPLMRVTLLRTGDDAYYFIWSSHHILLDGWCKQRLFEEVFTHYESYRRGKEVNLARPRPYRDYIAWLKQQDLKLAEDFWRRELKGFTAPTALPGDRGEGARLGEKIEEQAIQIDKETTRSLGELARKAQVTIGALIQGAWALILGRYSGQDDVAFGMTVSGRSAPLPEIESMIGLFINTLPVRARISGAETVRAFLKRLQARQAEALEYEYSPLMEVQNWSEIPRGTPLFDSTISFQNYPVDASVVEQTGSSLQISEVNTFAKSHFPLVVLAVPGAELFLQLTYDAGRFEAASVMRILQSLRQLLAAMAADPERRLGELEMLTAAERQQTLVEWNDTADNYDPPGCVTTMFEEMAERAGDAVAVISDEKGYISYAVLNEQANRLARYLRDLGVGPEALVALCLERGPEMVITMLAVLKAGGGYLPMDPGYPAERLAYMLDDAQVPILVTQGGVKAKLPGVKSKCIQLDQAAEAIGEYSGANLRASGSGENMAYMIYTSGSTGRPKGVMVTRDNLFKSTAARLRYYSEAVVKYLLASSVAFDSSVPGIFWTLCAGGSVNLVREGSERDPIYLASVIGGNEITHLLALPSLYNLILSYGKPENLRSLRAVIVAGEACPKALIERHHLALPEAMIFNEYGPTECTVWSSVYCCRKESLDHQIPIGRPIGNTQLYILDSRRRPVPIGVPGELYISGSGVARGYFKRPELTSEKFVPDPLALRPDGRLYRTGDLVRYLSDGNIEFLGRVDNQVKLRGYRIELGEIEAALERHEAVRQCVVCAREDEPGDKRLVAYVVTAGQRPLSTAELRAYLREKLPDHMIPSAFVEMAQLPLTSNGKLDRNALPSPSVAATTSANEEGARTPLEETVAGVWREVLKLERVGVRQNFFELGGHSLLATQVIVRLRDLLGIKLRFRTLFDNPTVEGLASAIAREISEGKGGEARRKEPQAIRPVRRDGYLPLSFAQQRLWFMDQLEPESISYNISMALRLRGPLNALALEQALTEIVRRHEILRTTFQSQDGQPRQVIGAAKPMILPIIDLGEIGKDAESHARRLVSKEAERPFNLSRGPLLRVKLLELAREDQVMTFMMHHIITDGWSLETLADEFAELYAAYGDGRASSLPEPELQYADFAVWQRGWLQGEILDEGLRYWKRELSGELPIIEFPGAKPRPKAPSYKGDELTLFLPSEIGEGFKEICRVENVTMFMALLAAFDILLHKYTGHEDIVIGTVIAGRTRAETEKMMGMFINILPLRVDLRGRPSYKETLKRVKESTAAGYAYQDIPIEKIIEELGMERRNGQAPFIQIGFGLETVPEMEMKLPNMQLEPFSFDREAVRFDLTVWLKETAKGLRATWTYRAELFDAGLITRMHNQFVVLLKNILATPDAELADLEILTEDEKKEEAATEKAREQARYEKLLAVKPKAIKPSYKKLR